MRLVKELYYTDGQFVQFLNILHRQCLRGLNLQQLGRNYFDPDNSVTLRDWKLALWPGYVTSIRQHERGVSLVLFTHPGERFWLGLGGGAGRTHRISHLCLLPLSSSSAAKSHTKC